jgi:hypothetical protein
MNIQKYGDPMSICSECGHTRYMHMYGATLMGSRCCNKKCQCKAFKSPSNVGKGNEAGVGEASLSSHPAGSAPDSTGQKSSPPESLEGLNLNCPMGNIDKCVAGELLTSQYKHIENLEKQWKQLEQSIKDEITYLHNYHLNEGREEKIKTLEQVLKEMNRFKSSGGMKGGTDSSTNQVREAPTGTSPTHEPPEDYIKQIIIKRRPDLNDSWEWFIENPLGGGNSGTAKSALGGLRCAVECVSGLKYVVVTKSSNDNLKNYIILTCGMRKAGHNCLDCKTRVCPLSIYHVPSGDGTGNEASQLGRLPGSRTESVFRSPKSPEGNKMTTLPEGISHRPCLNCGTDCIIDVKGVIKIDWNICFTLCEKCKALPYPVLNDKCQEIIKKWNDNSTALIIETPPPFCLLSFTSPAAASGVKGKGEEPKANRLDRPELSTPADTAGGKTFYMETHFHKCPDCGKEIPGSLERCWNCEEKRWIEHKNKPPKVRYHPNSGIMGKGFVCNKCGAQYKYFFNFCPDCGILHEHFSHDEPYWPLHYPLGLPVGRDLEDGIHVGPADPTIANAYCEEHDHFFLYKDGCPECLGNNTTFESIRKEIIDLIQQRDESYVNIQRLLNSCNKAMSTMIGLHAKLKEEEKRADKAELRAVSLEENCRERGDCSYLRPARERIADLETKLTAAENDRDDARRAFNHEHSIFEEQRKSIAKLEALNRDITIKGVEINEELKMKLEDMRERENSSGTIQMMCANDLKSAEAEIINLKEKLVEAGSQINDTQEALRTAIKLIIERDTKLEEIKWLREHNTQWYEALLQEECERIVAIKTKLEDSESRLSIAVDDIKNLNEKLKKAKISEKDLSQRLL